MARGLKFRIKIEQGLYYPCSENKDADQLRGNRKADLRLCFRICESWFSHVAAQLLISVEVAEWPMFVKDLLSFSILPICIFDHFQFGFRVQTFGCD